MSNIQAVVRYEDGSLYEVWNDYHNVEHIPDVDKIRKITFYNEAKEHVLDVFKGIAAVREVRFFERRDYLTHVGEMAQFIVYNW